MLNLYELCGYGAGILFASGFIPQIYKSYTPKIWMIFHSVGNSYF